jgi:hypothetical protein
MRQYAAARCERRRDAERRAWAGFDALPSLSSLAIGVHRFERVTCGGSSACLAQDADADHDLRPEELGPDPVMVGLVLYDLPLLLQPCSCAELCGSDAGIGSTRLFAVWR